MSNYTGSENSLFIYTNAGYFHISIRFFDGTLRYVSCGWSGGADDAWHHYAVTRRGDTIRIFRDGVLGISSQHAENTRTLATNSRALHIGSAVGGAAPSPGAVDDFRMMNHALQPAQVLALYNDGNGTASREKTVRELEGVASLERLALDGGFTQAAAVLQLSEGAYCDGSTWITASSENLKTDITPAAMESEWEMLDHIRPVEFFYKKPNPDLGRWLDETGKRVAEDSLLFQQLSDPAFAVQRQALENQGYRLSSERLLDEPSGPKRIGFVAEELAAVDERFQRPGGVAAIDIAATNTAVLKAMKARILDLEKRIATLERVLTP